MSEELDEDLDFEQEPIPLRSLNLNQIRVVCPIHGIQGCYDLYSKKQDGILGVGCKECHLHNPVV